MRLVVQKVHSATLTSENYTGHIDGGLLVTVGVGKLDTIADMQYLAEKIVNLRVFKDENGKVNLSVKDINGEIMLVSNFTLQANTKRGTRPDFSHAMEPQLALEMYNDMLAYLKSLGVKKVDHGDFGNHMHIECVLDGPFNLVLESEGR